MKYHSLFKTFVVSFTIYLSYSKLASACILLNQADSQCANSKYFIKEPYVSNVLDTVAVIKAQTNVSMKMKLGVWHEQYFLYSIIVPDANYNHRFILNGLKPDTEYTIQMIGKTTEGDIARSKTIDFATPANENE